MRGAGVQVLVVATDESADRADVVARGLLGLLADRKRPADAEVVRADKWFGLNRPDALQDDGPHALVLVTTAAEPWTAAHLDPLLDAIDRADHVFGRRAEPF